MVPSVQIAVCWRDPEQSARAVRYSCHRHPFTSVPPSEAASNYKHQVDANAFHAKPCEHVPSCPCQSFQLVAATSRVYCDNLDGRRSSHSAKRRSRIDRAMQKCTEAASMRALALPRSRGLKAARSSELWRQCEDSQMCVRITNVRPAHHYEAAFFRIALHQT